MIGKDGREYKTMEGEVPGICNCGRGNKSIAEKGYICQECYDEGWRAGKDMFDAFRKDPEFTIDDEGRIGVVPDYKDKWNKS